MKQKYNEENYITLNEVIEMEERVLRYASIIQHQKRIYGFTTFAYGRMSKGNIDFQKDTYEHFDFTAYSNEVELDMKYGSMGEYNTAYLKFPIELFNVEENDLESYFLNLENFVQEDNILYQKEIEDKFKNDEIKNMLRIATKHGYTCIKN